MNEKILLTHWIECDAYDRQAFERLTSESESLQALAASGSRLLPHFEGFLLDLFALLFKMNVLLHREDAVVPSAALFRFLLDQVRGAPGVQAIRQQTVLDEVALEGHVDLEIHQPVLGVAAVYFYEAYSPLAVVIDAQSCHRSAPSIGRESIWI